MSSQHWTAADVPDQQGRVAVITGANTGIGFETAKVLTARGASVVLAVRDVGKGKEAAAALAADVPRAEVTVQHLDLGSLASVREAASQLRSRLTRIDLLINNAGVMYTPRRQATTDGFELQFGTNHLGHFALTGLLLDTMLETPNSRVVTVSSAGHRMGGPMHFEDLNWERTAYDRTAAYGHSKLANLMFTYELQRRLYGRARTVALAAHPGGADTGGSKASVARSSLMFRIAFALLIQPFLIQAPDRGALPILRAATDLTVESGQYYGPDGFQQAKGYPIAVRSSAPSYDTAAQRRLWEISEKLTGVAFPV